MFFKAFAAFVRRSEGFLYLPSSAIALLNSLLFAKSFAIAISASRGQALSSLACSRQQHPG